MKWDELNETELKLRPIRVKIPGKACTRTYKKAGWYAVHEKWLTFDQWELL